MVAVIKSSANIRNALNYNEQKLKQEKAKLIHSMHFGKDTDRLGWTDKIKTFERLISLNQRTRLSAVHISLNFDPTEKPGKDTLQQIADTYMQQIGFGNQPYLVYQHHDAAHPHIHIVTTNIQRDGKRISMQNIGRNQSEAARKQIEKDFLLQPASAHALKEPYQIKPITAQKIQYGKSETRRAITNVLDAVLSSYKYSSLPELNAVLRQYNVMADRGTENSRTYKNNGLVYRILDANGNKIGVPIKASLIYNKPGMPFLSAKFIQNEPLKQPNRQRVKNAVDFTLVKLKQPSLDQLIAELAKEKIHVAVRRNDQGIIYGITYVDHQTKSVFNGSSLGKAYSANQLQERCRPEAVSVQSTPIVQRPVPTSPVQPPSVSLENATVSTGSSSSSWLDELGRTLTQSEFEGTTPAALGKNKKKKRRKRISRN